MGSLGNLVQFRLPRQNKVVAKIAVGSRKAFSFLKVHIIETRWKKCKNSCSSKGFLDKTIKRRLLFQPVNQNFELNSEFCKIGVMFLTANSNLDDIFNVLCKNKNL